MSNKADAVAITDEGTSYAELGHARLYVWNTGGLVWERMTQPGGSGGGGAVTVADGADVTQGALADAAIVTNTTGTISGKLRGLVAWAYTRMPAALGQTTMAGSLPVVIASDQSGVPTTLSGNPLVTNAGIIVDNAVFTDGTTKLQAIGYILDEVAGTALTENDMGAARMDSKRALVGTIEDATTRGQRAAVSAAGRLSVDASGVAVPITDNAGSLTVDAPVGTPVFVELSDGAAIWKGQKVMASSLPVTVASDQSAIPENMTQIAGTAIDVNSGTKSAGTQRVVLATDQPALTTPMPVEQVPGTSGGYTISKTLAAATTNATSVKGSAGKVFGWYLSNAAAYTVFFKLFNKATAPTVGTDVPVMTIAVPAGSAANVEFQGGIAFATGIGFSITKLVADLDTTVVVANDMVVNLFYK